MVALTLCMIFLVTLDPGVQCHLAAIFHQIPTAITKSSTPSAPRAAAMREARSGEYGGAKGAGWFHQDVVDGCSNTTPCT